MSVVCENCLMYRRGEIENLVLYGGVATIHLCEHIDGFLPEFGGCPCGCELREPGLIGWDQMMFGNAFLNERGARIDPATVMAVADDKLTYKTEAGDVVRRYLDGG